MTQRNELSPLQAYESAEQQKKRLGQAFRAKILRLHRLSSTNSGRLPHDLPKHLRQCWNDARSHFASAPPNNPTAIIAAYRDTVMRYGLKRINPTDASFARDLRYFYKNYVTNFPLPEEQESQVGFRNLWVASPHEGGYEEMAFSALCPLTGHYILGLNITIQPRSDSVHFIYGFVNPIARELGGFSVNLIQLMRDVSRPAVAAYFEQHPGERPAYHDPGGPLILFEKNIIDEMSLTEILMDTAGVDIDRPPKRGDRLAASSISQSMRDFIWDRRGARIIDFVSIQSSLDGVVRVPPADKDTVIAYLKHTKMDETQQQYAEMVLDNSLAGRVPGCRTLNLCAFVESETKSIPSAQVRMHNEIFQGISVVKDARQLHQDIYFEAQMASLDDHTQEGMVALKPITPCGPNVHTFCEAEQITKRLLAAVTWRELRSERDRTYGDWLRVKAQAMEER